MSFDGFLFSLKNAVSNIFRNYVLTIASVIVLGVCLLSLGSTMLVVQDVDAIVDSVGNGHKRCPRPTRTDKEHNEHCLRIARTVS